MDLQDLYQWRYPTSVAVSPEGGRVAAVVVEFDPTEETKRQSVFVGPTDGSSDLRRLTRSADAWAPTWGPEGTKLAVLSDRETDLGIRTAGRPDDSDDDKSDEDTSKSFPQVWVFDLDRGGDPRQLTTFDEGVRGFDWGPDGERLVVAARDPTEEQAEYLDRRREENGPIETRRLQHKADGEGFLDDVETYLFAVDVDDREVERFDDTGSTATRQPRWGDAGIAHILPHPDTPDDSYVTDIALLDPETGDSDRLTDAAYQYDDLAWRSDGRSLFAVRSSPDNWHVPNDACVVDVEDGSVRLLTTALDRTVVGVTTGGDTVYARVGDEGQNALYDVGGEQPRRAFPDDRLQSVDSLSADEDGTVLAGVVADPQRREVVAFHSSSSADGSPTEPTQLTTFTTPLAERCTHGFVRTGFENSEGQRIEALVYTPDSFDPDDPEPTKTIVDIHGGPTSYDRPAFGFRQAYWADRGYLVVKINYRGSTSYGRAFSECIRGDWGPRETDDIERGIRSLVERGWTDPDRVFVTGFSQGGVNTAYLLTRTDVATAGAAEHGVYDFYGLFGVSDTHRWYHNDFGLPWENEQQYRESSSLPDVGGIDAPLLITAGGEDHRCPQPQAEALYVACKKVGVPAKLVVYPETNHDYGEPDVRIHRLRSVTDWFEEHDPGAEDEE